MIRGALAGLAATVPMTAAMVFLHRRLPRREQYALPPGQLVAKAGVKPRDGTPALLAHFAFGAAAGALYEKLPVSGIVYGIGVWAASYLGWVPAAGLPQPPRRNAVMFIAHVIWGSTVQVLLRRRDGRA